MTKRKISLKAEVGRVLDEAKLRFATSFDAATEFEIVRSDLGEIETLATTAQEALEALQVGQTPEKRRDLGRLQALVSLTARTATAALDRADEAQRHLNRAMAAARARQTSPHSSRQGPR